ncbi:MAG: bifunctional 4-hydroxy-2-oxoglutarate aldolase/2-dehydro-3-deoxy-phosphogluconate aldolase [bacterium]
MSEVLETIRRHGLVPVIKLESADSAEPLARTLQESGLPLAEITFRTDAAEESIRRIAKSVPDVLVGAGTVLSIQQVQQAMEAGASFIVTPGFNPRVVEYCVANDIPVTPGVSNPTDVEAALEYALDILKFFPAGAAGGTAMLKALAGPYGGVGFIPTGGVKPDNLADYLELANVVAVGGSWMVPSDAIKNGDFEKVARLTREAVELTTQIRTKR